jgi:hypothetical protein
VLLLLLLLLLLHLLLSLLEQQAREYRKLIAERLQGCRNSSSLCRGRQHTWMRRLV